MTPGGAGGRRASGRRRWTLSVASSLAGVTAIGLFAALFSLADIDSQQRLMCEAVVALVEPARNTVKLNRETIDNSGRSIKVLYRTERPGSAEAPKLTEVHHVICTFAGVGLEAGRLTLTGVETSHDPLSETPLIYLNHRLLPDGDAVTELVSKLAREGDARIQGFVTLDMEGGYFLQQIVNAGPPSALYALLALAYSLVYGLTNRINLAFGEIATIGAFGALIGVLTATTLNMAQLSIALPLALLVALAMAGGTGAAIGRIVFLPLVGRASQSLLVATIGLALVIQEFLARAQGVRERWLQPILASPHRIADGPFDVVVTTMQLSVTAGMLGIALLVMVAMRISRFGRTWRAVADDRAMARLLGIDVDRVILTSFALGAGLAGLAGSILTLHYGGTSFALGTTIGLKALVAAIIGGIGSLPGAVIGGMALGLTETLWSAYQPMVWRDGVVFIALVAFLILRPEGILGTRRALEERDERL